MCNSIYRKCSEKVGGKNGERGPNGVGFLRWITKIFHIDAHSEYTKKTIKLYSSSG